MKPTEDQFRAALRNAPIQMGSEGTIHPGDPVYYQIARSFIATMYWETQKALHEIRNRVDLLDVDPGLIHEVQEILEEVCDDELR